MALQFFSDEPSDGRESFTAGGVMAGNQQQVSRLFLNRSTDDLVRASSDSGGAVSVVVGTLNCHAKVPGSIPGQSATQSTQL